MRHSNLVGGALAPQAFTHSRNFFLWILAGASALVLIAFAGYLYFQNYRSIEGNLGINTLGMAQTAAKFVEGQLNQESEEDAFSFEAGSEEVEKLKTALLSIQIRYGLEYTPFVVVRGLPEKKGHLPPYRVINQEGIVPMTFAGHEKFNEQMNMVLTQKRGLYTPVKSYEDGKFLEVFYPLDGKVGQFMTFGMSYNASKELAPELMKVLGFVVFLATLAILLISVMSFVILQTRNTETVAAGNFNLAAQDMTILLNARLRRLQKQYGILGDSTKTRFPQIVPNSDDNSDEPKAA